MENESKKENLLRTLSNRRLANYRNQLRSVLLEGLEIFGLTATHVIREKDIPQDDGMQQLDLFADYDTERKQKEEENDQLAREKRRQQAVLQIRKKYGKNAILKGMNYEEGATTRDRNAQIGGHKA